MAEQATPGTVQSAEGSGTGALDLATGGAGHATHHGRPISWTAVSIITIGFIVGGIGLVPHPTWWLFWTGVGIALVGCVLTAAARTFQTDWY